MAKVPFWQFTCRKLSALAARGDLAFLEPLLVTTEGVIIGGYAHWELARLENRPTLTCVEIEASDEDALQLLLHMNRPSDGLNDFKRILLALELEPMFKGKAAANQRKGGQNKGSSNLTEADKIDVRSQIASTAGVSAGNVNKVKIILQKADPRLIDGLQTGMLSINRAAQWCTLPRQQQAEKFTCYCVGRATNKVIRQAIHRLSAERTGDDPVAILDALHDWATRNPGSFVVRNSRLKRTVILIGQDLLAGLHPQAELELK